ncbi:MAG: multidrug effflux MFS transporter [Paracoccaceae bacterium]
MKQSNAVIFFDKKTPPHIFTLIILSGLGALSMSIFLSSILEMSIFFNKSYALMQLSISLYLVTTAFFQIIAGPLSDRYGRRLITLFSVILFILASIGCYLSTNFEFFIFFRILQASVAAGFLMSRVIIRDITSESDAASMIGYVTMGMSIIPLIAPGIGGLIHMYLGWSSIFLIMAFLGIILLFITFHDLGETKIVKIKKNKKNFNLYIELFKKPKFWGYSLTVAFSAGTFFSFLGGAPYVATKVYNLNSVISGLVMGFPAAGYFFGNYLSGKYSKNFGIDYMVLRGIWFVIFGMFSCLIITVLYKDTPYFFFGLCFFVGLGNGLIIPNASAGILSVNENLSGTAGGLGNAIMISTGAILAALASYLLENQNSSFYLVSLMLFSGSLSYISHYVLVLKNKTENP